MNALALPFEFGSLPLPLVAFGIGALHALDADHIMAVSSLAMRRSAPARCIQLGARWAAGHGVTLLTLGLLCYALGHALPEHWHVYAERAVAVLLCAVGMTVLAGLATGGARLRLHDHPGMAAHLHWVSARTQHERDDAADNHGAMLVGALHGTAGSAPMLALIPAGQQGDAGSAVLVLAAFSVGVLLAMSLFGLAVGFTVERSERALPWLRGLAGGGSVMLGCAIFTGSF
ncbi:MAG: urease accessory protein UreH domain-containing protein [Gammaproteobacteria bacterium]|jgi:cytochrome c biogenesis protein CcdA